MNTAMMLSQMEMAMPTVAINSPFLVPSSTPATDCATAAQGSRAIRPRTVDCSDCHNRATHISEDPEAAIDERMAAGLLDRAVPYLKRMALGALLGSHGSKETALLGIGAAAVLIPGVPLLTLLFLPNVVGGILLPVILLLMLKLVNDRRIMGSWVNSPLQNVVAWLTTGLIIALTIIYLIIAILEGVGVLTG